MTKTLKGLMLVCVVGSIQLEARENELNYNPGPGFPYGRPNPDAPPQIQEFAFMVGKSDCTERRRNGDEWKESTRTWDGRYELNGFAIMDSGRSGNGINGNMRIFDEKSGQWHVTFFSTLSYSSAVWIGSKQVDEIILKRPQVAPGTSLDGFSTLTFSNISDKGFDWRGEWISEDGKVVFPFWRISCHKVE